MKKGISGKTLQKWEERDRETGLFAQGCHGSPADALELTPLVSSAVKSNFLSGW